MRSKNAGCSPTSELRRRAEELLQAQTADSIVTGSVNDYLRLLHELQVHQIQLEMQNNDLRQARFELETVLEKYTDLYEFAPVGFLTLDIAGRIRGVNLLGASLMGKVRSQIVGRRFQSFITAKHIPVFNNFLNTVLVGHIKDSCELELLNEAEQPVIVQLEAMATASGQEFRLALIDVSARRLAEEKLAKKQQELEELNIALELRIHQAVDDLRQKDQTLILLDRRAVMGEMINNIAHQWRQPLNTLGLYLQELLLDYDAELFSRELLDKNVESCMVLIMQMSQTIDDFKNYFRSDKERISFAARQPITTSVSLVEKSLEYQNISVETQVEGEPMIYGYPNEYAQVLMNILMNARDAFVEGVVDNSRILVRAFEEGGKTIVTVTDNGGGIADEIITKIFDPYFTTKGPDKGTGIGLFMSKSIIEKHMGGCLTVRNVGSGAEFRIEV